MKYSDKEYNRLCSERSRVDSDCFKKHGLCKECGTDVCINNNPVINLCVSCEENGTEQPKPFLSSYMEALGKGQSVQTDNKIVFETDSVDSVGNNIELDASGTTFTINRTGLYHVEWNINLARDTASAVVGIMENGVPASGSATCTGGNFASGTLILVETVPFTLSLYNYYTSIVIEDIMPYEATAASIRIVRFADGPSS